VQQFPPLNFDAKISDFQNVAHKPVYPDNTARFATEVK
jgi:hypothetical protein